MLRMPRSIMLCLGLSLASAHGRQVSVAAGANLQAAVDAAQGGDTLLIAPGTFNGLKIVDRIFSAAAPLVLKKAPGTGEAVVGEPYWKTIDIKNCSYLVLDGLNVDRGGKDAVGIWVSASDHIIIRGCKVLNLGHGGIHVQTSEYVDLIDNVIGNTGMVQDAYGEGIYIGTGSTSAPFPDRNDYIWIEGNEIYENGHGEAINVKSEAFHVTVRRNDIHDVHPSTATQLNQGGISINDAQLSVNNNYELNISRDVWVEDNTVTRVSGGLKSGWNNCITFFGTGVMVLRNKVSHCADFGILGHRWNNLEIMGYVHGNEISSSGTAMSIDPSLEIAHADPGPNPNVPQTWYGRQGTVGGGQAPARPRNGSAGKILRLGPGDAEVLIQLPDGGQVDLLGRPR